MSRNQKWINLGFLMVLFSSTFAWAADGNGLFVSGSYYSYDEPGVMNHQPGSPFVSVGIRDYAGLYSGKKAAWSLETGLGVVRYTDKADDGKRTHQVSKFAAELLYPLSNGMYAGVGYRLLADDGGPGQTSTGRGMYDRKTEYLYAPVGVLLKNADRSAYKAQVNILLQGIVSSRLSQVSGYLNDPVNRQSKGVGLDLAYLLPNQRWEVFLNYWFIQESDHVRFQSQSGGGYAFEPKNRTIDLGVRHYF